MIPYQWFIQAKARISPYTTITPLTYDETHDVYLKWENHQVTGSFKARGAFNKVLSLEKWEQDAGLLAASAGNHGQGVALAGRLIGAPVIIFVPDNAPMVKIKAIQNLGAMVKLIPGGYQNAEMEALRFAGTTNATWISPYNDGTVIAGQGTIGLEVIEQMESKNVDWSDATWLVPTSGGGLLAGVGTAVKEKSLCSRIIGVQTDTSPFMHAIFYHGSQDGIIERPTIADGLAGPVEAESITIPLVRELIDGILLVSESEMAKAVAYAWHYYGEKIEPSAAVTLAALLAGKIKNRPVIAIISGGNIQETLFRNIIQDET
jgi:threonine dehydratase